MSDFENRLITTLHDRAEGAPGATGLAQAARGRARRRRTTGIAVAAVAVTGLLVALPLGLRLGVVDDSAPVATPPEPEVNGIPADWRWESYRNIEFAVPPTWGYGSLDDWCANDGKLDDAPRVERPGVATLAIACPSSGYGVRIGAKVTNVPAGAVALGTEVGGIRVTVVGSDQEVAETVIGSVREIPGQDFYGCHPARAVPPIGEMKGSSALGRNGVVTMCRYELGIEGPNLVSSEGVPEEETAFWPGLESAVPGTGPDSGPETCIESPETEAVLIKTGAEDYAWVHYTGCAGHGIDIGGTTYRLNEQVMYWALPRGGFALDGSVPIPKELRK